MPPPAASAPSDPPHRGRPGSHGRETAEERAERHLRMLRELAEIGMDMARLARQEARARVAAGPAEAPQGGDPGLAYSRIARAVRLTLALEDKLGEDRRARDEQQRAERAAADARERTQQRKRQVKRIVEQAIEIEEIEPVIAEELRIDVAERLIEDDETRFLDLPIRVLVRKICNDLDIPFFPTYWTDEHFAVHADPDADPGGDCGPRPPGAPPIAPPRAPPKFEAWSEPPPRPDGPPDDAGRQPATGSDPPSTGSAP
jgi:hypothetical protein